MQQRKIKNFNDDSQLSSSTQSESIIENSNHCTPPPQPLKTQQQHNHNHQQQQQQELQQRQNCCCLECKNRTQVKMTELLPIIVAPLGKIPLTKPACPFVPRAAAIKSTRRNLFGSPEKGEINALLAQEEREKFDQVLLRYNVDIPAIEKEERLKEQLQQHQQQQQQQRLVKPYARPQGVKAHYRVRKDRSLNSNVPKENENNNNNTNNNNHNNNNSSSNSNSKNEVR